MEHSEYDGGGVMPNTVYPKGSDALTPSDKLRLQSITGQEEDSRAAPDPYFWHGNLPPDTGKIRSDRQHRLREERKLAREERNRYKETKGNY